MISLRNIAEQCGSITKKGSTQELIQASVNAYGLIVKKLWYEGRNDGVSEINGSFIFTFKDLLPTFDDDLGMFFITIPSSYLELPNESGVNMVSWMRSQDRPFVRLGTGAFGLFAGLQSSELGGNDIYTIEGSTMYFPNFKDIDVNISGKTRGILLKLAIAFDDIDIDEQLNISPAIQGEIVDMVVARYQPRPNTLTDNLE